MEVYLQLLSLIFAGILLLWFGYTMIFGQRDKNHFQKLNNDEQQLGQSWQQRENHFQKLSNYGQQQSGNEAPSPGDPQVCPVCSSKLPKGDQIKTLAFPSITGGKDRQMHINGCVYCMEGDSDRNCPVCKKTISKKDILIARMFHRPLRRPHVHILGCNQCGRK
jgi:hypothetical protein